MKMSHLAGATIQGTAKVTDWKCYGGYFADPDIWEFDYISQLLKVSIDRSVKWISLFLYLDLKQLVR